MLWKSSECQRPAQSSPRSSSRSRRSRPWSVQQARKEAARRRVRVFTEYRHSFTPSAGGGAPGAGQAMMAFPYDWLRDSRPHPSLHCLSSFGLREDDRLQDSWRSGSDFGSDRVRWLTSVPQVHICCSLTVCTVLLLSAAGCPTISSPLHSLSLLWPPRGLPSTSRWHHCSSKHIPKHNSRLSYLPV